MKQTTRIFSCLLGLLAAFLLIAGCMGAAPTAGDGDTVRVHYILNLSDGSTHYNTLEDEEPFEFTLGEKQVISGFENAVRGMVVGEEKTVTIPYDQAYGPYDEENMLEIERELFPEELTEIGTNILIPLANGQVAQGIVFSTNETHIILDMNHRLAGEDLTFTITLVEIL